MPTLQVRTRMATFFEYFFLPGFARGVRTMTVRPSADYYRPGEDQDVYIFFRLERQQSFLSESHRSFQNFGRFSGAPSRTIFEFPSVRRKFGISSCHTRRKWEML